MKWREKISRDLKEVQQKIRCLNEDHDYVTDRSGFEGFTIRCCHCCALLDAGRLDKWWAVPASEQAKK